MLKTVLLMQSESGGGCDGGGKEALVQEDKSETLGTGNDQTIFCLQGNGIDRADTAGCNGKGWREDTSYTLNTIDRPAVCAGFEATPINLMVATRCKELGRGTGFGVGNPGDPANTITTAHSHGVFATAIPINDKATRWQGGGERRNQDGSGNGLGIGKEGDPSPTLTAGDRHGVASISGVDGYNGDLNGGLARDSVLCAGFKAGQGAQAGGIGYSEEVSPTLAAAPSGTNQTPAVVALDMTHACDVIRECGEVAPSLQARMGTGGNQVPLVTDCGFFNCYENTSPTLLARMYKDPRIVASPEKTDSICAKSYPSKLANQGIVNGCYPAVKGGNGMVVRRLTPIECERLQGFPDHWTDIGEWHDSKGKLRKPSDSPRYKALGNSIALPFWDFLAKRISSQYLRPVTMGSLFDGIGGFPLVFERHNGKGTARWASEIEEFPIAVTKLRFGEE